MENIRIPIQLPSSFAYILGDSSSSEPITTTATSRVVLTTTTTMSTTTTSPVTMSPVAEVVSSDDNEVSPLLPKPLGGMSEEIPIEENEDIIISPSAHDLSDHSLYVEDVLNDWWVRVGDRAGELSTGEAMILVILLLILVVSLVRCVALCFRRRVVSMTLASPVTTLKATKAIDLESLDGIIALEDDLPPAPSPIGNGDEK